MPFVEIKKGYGTGGKAEEGLFLSVSRTHTGISGTVAAKLKYVKIFLDKESKKIAFQEVETKEEGFSVLHYLSQHSLSCKVPFRGMNGRTELKFDSKEKMWIGSYKDIVIDE
jgi:ligand-binding sensor domain-containing protein